MIPDSESLMKWLAGAILFVFGTFTGAGFLAATQAPPPPKRDDPPYRSLDANLYMQTSAEYRACCYQAFSLAESRLRGILTTPYRGPCRAVILDLDETVIDNGAFQATMIRNGWAFDSGMWNAYEQKYGDRVELIPGAKAFLDVAKSLGFAICYVSNRSESSRAAMHVTLDRLGIDVPDGQLLLATTTSDKTERRAKVAASFCPVLLIGDNLRDFDDRFRYDPQAGIDGRKREVDAVKSEFGYHWIILPNPAYGEWMKPFGKGKVDADALVPSLADKP
jgi:5'-nucleotidase (lipoprotein e(P4) family)